MFREAVLLLAVLADVDGRLQQLSPHRVPQWMRSVDANRGPDRPQPEQIHLSYSGRPSVMYVTWLTFDDVGKACVEYGESSGRTLPHVAAASVYRFNDSQAGSRVRFVYRAAMSSLAPGRAYRYHVGSAFGWSAVYEFTALAERADGGHRLLVFGDMGNENARSLGAMQQLAQRGDVDLALHIGDFAYDMNEEHSKRGDEFMRQIEPLAAYVPYMVAVGNHENSHNFTQYVHRFTMPGDDDGLMYSFDLGLVHFVVLSSEFYFFTAYGYAQIANQWRWLIGDLEAANARRAAVPWIVTLAHRPMYCSDFDGDDCTRYESVMRCGLPGTHAFGLEKLLFQYGVDLELWAHEHSYERMYPLYNRTVFNGTEAPYVDPPAPVHIVTGSAGCREKTDTFVKHPPPWSAFRSSNYGFGIMQAHNATHLHFQQVAAATAETEDDVWIVKSRHGKRGRGHVETLQRAGTHIPLDYCHHPKHCAKYARHSHL